MTGPVGGTRGGARPRFSEEWLVTVLDSLSEGVIALDAGGRVVAANPAAEEILGFSIATSRYCPWDDLAWRDLVDEQLAPLPVDDHPVAASVRSGRPRATRVVGLPGPEELSWLALASHVLPDMGPGVGSGVTVSFRDVTDRVRAEHELRRAVDFLRDFLTAAAHDLRNPIVTIVGLAELLGDAWADLPDEDRATAAASIVRQARNADRLVGDLGLAARLEAGNLRPRSEDITVDDLVGSAVDGLADHVELEVTTARGTAVRVDRDHGRRMLVNLLENAVRHGAPPFEVTIDPAGDDVEFTVVDHGTGVPPGFAPQLFERFTRAPGVRTGGSGLGLAIVAGLAELNGGGVRYEPNEPAGARFVLRLPNASR